MENYCKEIVDDIQQSSPKYVATHCVVKKNNGTVKNGISITEKGQEDLPRPTFYIENMEKPAHQVASELIVNYENQKGLFPSFDVRRFTDFEWIKGNLLFQIVNKPMNANDDIPHIDITKDLMAVFRVDVGNDGSFLVNRQQMKEWGTDEKTLYKLALINSQKKDHVVFSSIEDMLLGILKDRGNAEDQEIVSKIEESKGNDTLGMYVLTSQQQSNRSIFYDGVLSSIEKEIGPVIILPSSVCEWIIIPKSKLERSGHDLESLKCMVREVNDTQVLPEQRLSDEVFYYDSKTGFIQLSSEEQIWENGNER